MKKFMKAFGFMVLVAVSYLLASVMSGVVIGGYLGIKNAALMDAQGMDAFNDAMMAGMADLMLPMLIMINVITLVLVMLYFLGRKDKFIQYVQFKKFKVMDGIYLAILGIFMNLFLIACLQYASRLLPIDNQMEQYAELMEGILNGNFIMILMALTISAPLFEEIVIRGIVFNDFKKAVPVWVAILIQALVFGIMHMNMIQGTYAFFLGLVLGVVYYKYKSIWAPIILHFTFNMTSTLLSQFATEAQMESMLVGMLVVGLIGSAFMGFVLYRQYVAEDYPEVIEVEASAQVVDNTDVLIEETVSESL